MPPGGVGVFFVCLTARLEFEPPGRFWTAPEFRGISGIDLLVLVVE